MDQETKNTFETLSKINVNDKVKSKIGLKYLSWAYAWETLQTAFPGSTWKIYTRKVEVRETLTEKIDENTSKVIETSETREIPYFTDGSTAYVKVGVTVNGNELTEIYPIMDLKNAAVKTRFVTMTDVNKAIQRAFVKCVARHGLGLYIYAGEDLPEVERNQPFTVSDATDLNSVKKDVIALIQKISGTSHEGEMVRYVTEMFQGTKISETNESHLDNLIAARSYLSSLVD